MAHKRSLNTSPSGPSSVNRFIVPAEHTGEDVAVLLPKTLQETKQTAQNQILQQRDGGGGGPGHKNTKAPPSIGDTGFSDVGTGYRDDFAIQAGVTNKGTHKAKAISDKNALTASMVDATQVTGWDALGLGLGLGLGGIAATAVKLGVGTYARNKAIEVINTRRARRAERTPQGTAPARTVPTPAPSKPAVGKLAPSPKATTRDDRSKDGRSSGIGGGGGNVGPGGRRPGSYGRTR